ncbi:MAG: L,D-transpeptidase [Chloroflexi bacterium]|nr:L,D-transpeptidase [Chloroflexota bacterium]
MYTRRQFLQLAGIAAIGSRLPSLFTQSLRDTSSPVGRALDAAAVYRHPALEAAPVGQLWPDSIVPILGERGAWYQTPGGYVARDLLQPMKPAPPFQRAPLPSEPFWAEVAGPVAAVRRYCGADAPLVTRIGHGGVARVIDALPDEPAPWYGIASDTGDLLGWTQAVHWRAVETPEAGAIDLEVDVRAGRLTAWEDGRAVLQAPCSTGQTIRPGVYSITGRLVGGARLDDFFGLPWRVTFGDYDLTGVYWHNRFGAAVPGPSLQVTPLLAEWLYHSLQEGRSRLTIL